MNIKCPFPTETKHGYLKVMVHPVLDLCEVGEGCLKKCQYAFTKKDVEPCPVCKGKPDVENPPYGCPHCDVFGIVRKVEVKMIELVRSGSKIKVRLHDGRKFKIVGEIRQVEGGYQYFPKGSKTGGDVLPSINAVRATL